MKVLFAGLKYDYGIISRGESLESKAFVPALSNSSTNLFTFWLEENGFPDEINSLQRRLIDYAEQVKPDVVFFILMKDEISIDTLSYLSKKYITINWFCDDTWRFEDFTKKILPYLSFAITTEKYALNEYKKNGYNNVILSQWATIDYDKSLKPNNVVYKYDVSFIGGKNPTRSWIVDQLKNNNISVNCFGSGWENGRVSYDEMKDIFYHSKINLNLSNSTSTELLFFRYILKNIFSSFFQIFNKTMKQYLSDFKRSIIDLRIYFSSKKTSEQMKARNFEIPGFGGFQLSQYSLGIEDYYEVGKEIAIYSNVQELIKQCRYYLENDEFRKNICLKGYLRTKEHTYINRIKIIFDNLMK
jgi:spore maturation protein CgeB